ncbi:hypothetical protein QBC41DRAFT_343266 [Cercophora samala]|uniref:DNA-binding protein RAP1 n=1 Tax=Cercophora samala TaxID=330535 RepID=A0AA40DH00_9PEZI|nr:hypothetical protein QBC41DRAFT_343266 [Cercophora samala]
MPQPIVYEGVNGSYEGTLFNGLKFFVSQRVPLRSEVLGKIKNNGGKTVQLEKFADVVIWDYLIKHGAPTGAVSTRFVEDCISKGEIVNKEEYLVATPAAPISSSASVKKGTRAPFTPKDDQLLLSWVRQKEEAGESTRGNAIYQELAAKYPHHTYQSWRSRYVDKLSRLPQQSIRPLPPPIPTPVKSKSSTSARAAPPSTSLEADSPSVSRGRPSSAVPVAPPSSSTVRKKSPKRREFTKEDDAILLQHLERWQGSESGNNAYKHLEEQYPHHTWQSWRNRYVKILSKRRDSGSGDEPVRAPPPRREPPAPELPPAKRPRTSTDSGTVPSSTPMAPPPTQLEMSEKDRASYEALQEKKRKMAEAKAAKAAKAAKQGNSNTQTSTSGQAQASSRATSSSRVEGPRNQAPATGAASSTPLPTGSQREDLARKMAKIRARNTREGTSTPAKAPQAGLSGRTPATSSSKPPPATTQTPGFKTQVSVPNIDSPAFQTQVSEPVVETPQAQHVVTIAQQKQLEQARIQSRKKMTGLINSRESWLGLRRVFYEFIGQPEPSETITVFGREVDCWELWSEVVEVGYPPSPAAWVLIAEGLGFVDDQELLEEGQRSVVQALKEGFEEHLVEFWLATEWFAGVGFEAVEVEEEGEE